MAPEITYDAIRFKYRNTPVIVVAQKSLGEFTIQDRSFGPLEQDRELEVPRWVAEVLITQNYARLKDLGIELPDLQKALWRETGEAALQPLPANFFFLVTQYIAHLARENEKSPNDVRQVTQNKMEHLLRDLVANRLLKLMKIAIREERLYEAKKKMTEEEQWLIDQLASLFRKWQNHVLEIDIND